MRIALLARRFDSSGGGTERDLIVTARGLVKAGHEARIYASEIRGEIKNTEFKVKLVDSLAPGRAARLISFAYAAPKAARRDGADLVLSFARTVDADILRAGGSAHACYVRAARQWRGAISAGAMWASPYHRAQMLVERRGFTSPRLKLAIAVSNLVRADLVREFKLAEDKVVTLYNGVDLERFAPPRDDVARREIRSRLGLAGDTPVVAFVGNGFARKGLRFLIQAWPAVGADAHLLVVGNDRSASWYRAEAMRLKVANRIHFAGARHDVAEIFHAVDALALPSLFEPFGNVIMEAMASGLGVLASAQSGASELLPEPMTKFMVANSSDPGEIASKMNLLLSERHGLCAIARDTAAQYTWDRYARELAGIVDRVA